MTIRRTLPPAVVLTLALIAGPLSVAPSVAEATPLLAGTTTVHADGSGWTTLEAPQHLKTSRGEVTIDRQNQPAAFAALVPRRCIIMQVDGRSCPAAVVLAMEDYPLGQHGFFDSPTPNVVSGPVDVLIVADGPVTVTFTFEELDGQTEVTATRPLTGVVEPLARRCPEQFEPCEELAYGGTTHSLGDIGVGMDIAWTYVPKLPDGTANLVASRGYNNCGAFERRGDSVDPDDYPYGCDYGEASQSGQGEIRQYVLNSHPLQGDVTATSLTTIDQGGLAYSGFSGHAITPFRNGRVGAWGAWVPIPPEIPDGVQVPPEDL